MECVGVSQSQGVPETVVKISHVVAIKMPESDCIGLWDRLADALPGSAFALNFTCCFFNGNPNYSEANTPPFYLHSPLCELRHSMFHVLLLRVFLFFGGEMKNFALKLIEGSPALTPRNVLLLLLPCSTMLIPF